MRRLTQRGHLPAKSVGSCGTVTGYKKRRAPPLRLLLPPPVTQTDSPSPDKVGGDPTSTDSGVVLIPVLCQFNTRVDVGSMDMPPPNADNIYELEAMLRGQWLSILGKNRGKKWRKVKRFHRQHGRVCFRVKTTMGQGRLSLGVIVKKIAPYSEWISSPSAGGFVKVVGCECTLPEGENGAKKRRSKRKAYAGPASTIRGPELQAVGEGGEDVGKLTTLPSARAVGEGGGAELGSLPGPSSNSSPPPPPEDTKTRRSMWLLPPDASAATWSDTPRTPDVVAESLPVPSTLPDRQRRLLLPTPPSVSVSDVVAGFQAETLPDERWWRRLLSPTPPSVPVSVTSSLPVPNGRQFAPPPSVSDVIPLRTFPDRQLLRRLLLSPKLPSVPASDVVAGPLPGPTLTTPPSAPVSDGVAGSLPDRRRRRLLSSPTPPSDVVTGSLSVPDRDARLFLPSPGLQSSVSECLPPRYSRPAVADTHSSSVNACCSWFPTSSRQAAALAIPPFPHPSISAYCNWLSAPNPFQQMVAAPAPYWFPAPRQETSVSYATTSSVSACDRCCSWLPARAFQQATPATTSRRTYSYRRSSTGTARDRGGCESHEGGEQQPGRPLAGMPAPAFTWYRT